MSGSQQKTARRQAPTARRQPVETPGRRTPAPSAFRRSQIADAVPAVASRGERLLGLTEPRVFTPPLRELTEETSLGYEAILFAEEDLGLKLVPWQKWALVHILELTPDGNLRFRTVVLLIARQNGKSWLSIILALFFMFLLGRKLVIGTAQDLETAEAIWQEAVDLLLEEDDDEELVRPELAGLVANVTMGNGKRTLTLTTSERYKVKAANRRAGRGLSGDLVMLDELREHQTWDAWGAITKTTMARAFALILCLSNAGDASSIVLRHLRKMAHLALGDPDGINREDDDPADLMPDDVEEDPFADELDDGEEAVLTDDTLGLFEWSAPPGMSKWDRRGWAQANPSCGYTELDERAIASACATDPEWIFRTEVLCQWSSSSASGAFPYGAWEAGHDPNSRRDPESQVCYGIDVSFTRGMTRIATASMRADGTVHGEVIASRAGTDWVADWFLDPAHPQRRLGRIAGQGKGAPVSSVIADLHDLVDDNGEALLRVTPWQGDQLPLGCARFYDAVAAGGRNAEQGGRVTIFHRPSPILDVAVACATTKGLGDGGWVWDRKKSTVDISGLVALNAAYWLLTQPEEDVVESAYERHGLEMI